MVKTVIITKKYKIINKRIYRFEKLEDEMSAKSENALAFGIGTLVGVLAGVVAAVLFSPKSGEEMRKDLKVAAKKIISEKIPNTVYTNKINSAALVRLQYTIESQFNKIIDAIKAGRMAAAKRKEELESAYRY